ncbi:MAG TPA: TOMM precursor leader peptide-binding protein [Candidatus Sumerlaeota bacterium]|nr:TOMM precursor leader peptide-binding protein [Candidatus Sumerlaeota bacterium]
MPDNPPRPEELPALSPAELVRYGRHLALPRFGEAGQRRLKRARALIVGLGGLGCPASLYLAAAGVGTLGLIEFDRVDESNLHRQVLYTSADAGRPKLEVALERLRAVNPHVRFEPHAARLNADNALDLVSRYDLVLDGADNFATRYLVNDACVLAGRPNVYGSIYRFEGKVALLAAPAGRDHPRGPCYRCLYPEPPPAAAIPNCAEGGVLGVLPGLVGALQAAEAIKWLARCGEPLAGRVLLIDSLTMEFRTLRVARDPACPVCGDRPTITRVRQQAARCAASPAAAGPGFSEISPAELHDRMQTADALFLIDVREPFERDICRIDGAHPIPLGQFAHRLDEIPREAEVVIYCKSGGRSAMAAALLARAGYPRVANLTGGILAWADVVDPVMRRY